MVPELGNLSIMLAFILSIIQALSPWLNRAAKQVDYTLTSACLLGQSFLVFFAFACLVDSFIQNDFSVMYVARHSSDSLPFFYRIGAAWGGHEGSLLLWICMVNAWSFILWIFSQRIPKPFMEKVFAVLGFMNIGFLSFMLLTSNPFERSFPDVPLLGNDLNPILQDPGLIFHPPMLYMGYVGFAIAFAFALAALWEGKISREWARWVRPWAMLSWASLTLGIILGSWWAYHVLGWGGWWAWDPVENASFLPWLLGTALIHSLAVMEKRGCLKSWTVLLALLTFSLSLMGTFLVRSGVLISVHAFANDPARGVYLLAYLFSVVGISMLLYAFRAHQFTNENHYEFISRETFLLSNNVLLMVMMGTILLGTLYPLIIDTLTGVKISVGTPYFNRVFVPFALLLFALMGVGALSHWQEMSIKALHKKIQTPLVLAFLFALVSQLWFPVTGFGLAFCGMMMGAWVILSSLDALWQRWRLQNNTINLPFLGMLIAHIGVGFSILGVTVVSHYSLEREVAIAPGEIVTLGDIRFNFQKLFTITGENYTSTAASFHVYQPGKQVAYLQPEKRYFTVSKMMIGQSAIFPRLLQDIYIALGDPLGHDKWSVRLYIKPMLRFIWLGGLLMMIGGILALVGRLPREKKT